MERAEAPLSAFAVRVVGREDAGEPLARALSSLAAQLRGGEPLAVSVEWLETMLAFPQTWLLIAEQEQEANAHAVVGMLILSAFPRISGWTPWIESVIVDEAVRRQGIGRALVETAVEIARAEGFSLVNLSCRPHRKTANALYESLGFDIVPTNYRRLPLSEAIA